MNYLNVNSLVASNDHVDLTPRRLERDWHDPVTTCFCDIDHLILRRIQSLNRFHDQAAMMIIPAATSIRNVKGLGR